MPNAARITDTEAPCPAGDGGPIVTGASTVFIEGQPAARVGDDVDCDGGPSHIESGSPTVGIEGAQAARVGDTTCHGGKIATGARTVFIGNGVGSRSTTLDKAKDAAAPFVKG